MMSHALWFRRFGPPAEVLSLEAAPPAPLEPGMMRVRMMAMPINPSDLIPITGAYRHRVVPPRIAGYEGLGTVIETGPAHAGLLHRRVLPLRGEGTWQTYVACDPALAVVVPDDIRDDRAARGYINPLAAHRMIARWPAKGLRVIVTAAGSTCADLLAQWALADGASHVTGIHRSSSHADRLRRLGMQPLGLGEHAAVEAAARKADLVFDAVGGALGSALLHALPATARFISYGMLSGTPAIPAPGGVRPERFHLRDELAMLPTSEWQAHFVALWPKLRMAALPPAACFSLSRWREALALFETEGRHVKPMLAID